MNRKRISLVGVAVVAIAAVGAQPLLAEGDEASAPAEPGIPYVDETPNLAEAVGEPEAIVTSGGVYDPTIVTKFIPGSGFNPMQGAGASLQEDVVHYVEIPTEAACVAPGAGSAGVFTEFLAGVELPDGARVKRIVFYGEDNNAANITVRFARTTLNFPALVGVPTRTEANIASFTTAAASGVVSVASADNLEEVVGSTGSVITGFNHRFHTIEVELTNAALDQHMLCGVEIQYQVLASAEDPGTVFHPISPIRAVRLPQPGLSEPWCARSERVENDQHQGRPRRCRRGERARCRAGRRYCDHVQHHDWCADGAELCCRHPR